MLLRRLLLLAAFLIASSVAQRPRSYFSLQTSTTFAPGTKVAIALQSENIDQLEFRVYRIKDAEAFLAKLPDATGFGGQAPPVPKKRNWVESIRDWKESTRFAMRRLVKKQFGLDEQQAIRTFFNRRPAPPSKNVQTFAEVPLLNADQLVKRWTVRLAKKQSPWEPQSVDFDLPGTGLYIVEATDQEQRAATIVNVTGLAILKKAAPGLLVTQVVDRALGAPRQASIEWIGIEKKASDVSGIAQFSAESERAERHPFLLARSGNDLAIASVEQWAFRSDREEIANGYVYTDRPIYRPSHKVGMRAILRGEDARGWTLPKFAEVDCEIQGPEGQVVHRATWRVSEFGTVSGDWTLPQTAALGYYSIRLHAGEANAYGSFQVEEYRKPEYEVKVTSAKKRVLQGEQIEFIVDARYFFGEPVAKAKVNYRVMRGRYWPDYWADEDRGSDEESEGSYYANEQVSQGEAALDARGHATIRIPTERVEFDQTYLLVAEVTDAAKRAITGRGFAVATVGPFALLASPDRYVYAPGETMQIRVEARDYDGNPVGGVNVSAAGARATTAADGKATLSLAAPAAGSHQIPVTAGRVKTTLYVWVSGRWRDTSSQERRIQLIPDKKKYTPGDIAKVLVVAGSEDTHLLLGVEGRALHKHETKLALGGSTIWEVPVESHHTPNLFLTAAALSGGQYLYGSKSVSVPPDERLLRVNIQSSKPSFKPGEPATYIVEARDSANKPVTAEFSLGIVDEAIYAVAPDTTQKIERAFYGPTYDRVMTSSSLAFYFSGQSGKRAMPIAGMKRPPALGQLKPPRPNDPRIRKAFPDTALWLANITTDANGRAEAKLQFPDSITAWRATVRGVTRDTRVGSAVNRVTTRKDLILRLATPRFMTEGDEVTISAIVNNYLATDAPVKIELDAKGLDELDGKTRDGVAKAGVETAFEFRVRARSVEKATITAKALAVAESDALEIELPVLPYGAKSIETHSGVLTDGAAKTSIAGARTIDVRTLPSLSGAMFGAIEYLSSFPYGCTEQTLSSFLPNLIVDDAIRSLGLPVRQDRARLNARIDAGVERLRDFQHPDGGWGWWQSDDSGAFMTAHVLAGIHEFERAGRTWRPDSKERARLWLTKAFATEKRAHPDFRAYMAYALRDPKILDIVWAERDQLSAYGLALVGLSMGNGRAKEAADRLEKLAVADGDTVYWKAERDSLLDLDADASAEATAYAVKLLSRAQPQSPLIPKAARWLLANRNQGAYWSSTKQTAMVIYGLIEYVKDSGELNPELMARIRVNGESAYVKELVQADALSPTPAGLRLTPKSPQTEIEVSASGKGRLYWSVDAVRYDAANARGDNRLRISRDYWKQENGKLVPFAGLWQTGDVIASRITVEGTAQRYLLIEDPIPAGAELIDQEDRWWVRRERRDDRAAIFETYFNGKREYVSLMKVTRPGKFRVSPARVAPMYQPNISATSTAALIEVAR